MGLALVVSPPDSQALLCIRGQGSHLRCSLQAVSPPTPAPHCDLALCLLCSTLCDNLRRERDRAVSELAEALRSLDDTRKQKNDVSRELKELKEQMESQLEKEARFRQLMAHSSHDSAIDTDSMEWETEVVEFERETVSWLSVFFSLPP